MPFLCLEIINFENVTLSSAIPPWASQRFSKSQPQMQAGNSQHTKKIPSPQHTHPHPRPHCPNSTTEQSRDVPSSRPDTLQHYGWEFQNKVKSVRESLRPSRFVTSRRSAHIWLTLCSNSDLVCFGQGPAARQSVCQETAPDLASPRGKAVSLYVRNSQDRGAMPRSRM